MRGAQQTRDQIKAKRRLRQPAGHRDTAKSSHHLEFDEYIVPPGGVNKTSSGSWRAELSYMGQNIRLSSCRDKQEAREQRVRMRRILQSHHKTRSEMHSMTSDEITSLIQAAREELDSSSDDQVCCDDASDEYIVQAGSVSQGSRNSWRGQLSYMGRAIRLSCCKTKAEAGKQAARMKHILQSFQKTKSDSQSLTNDEINSLIQRARDEIHSPSPENSKCSKYSSDDEYAFGASNGVESCNSHMGDDIYIVAPGSTSATATKKWRAQLSYMGKKVNLRSCADKEEAQEQGARMRQILQSYCKTGSELQSMTKDEISALVEAAKDELYTVRNGQKSSKESITAEKGDTSCKHISADEYIVPAGCVFEISPGSWRAELSYMGNAIKLLSCSNKEKAQEQGARMRQILQAYRKTKSELRSMTRGEIGGLVQTAKDKLVQEIQGTEGEKAIIKTKRKLHRFAENRSSKKQKCHDSRKKNTNSDEYVIPRGCIFETCNHTWNIVLSFWSVRVRLPNVGSRNKAEETLLKFRKILQSYHKTKSELKAMPKRDIEKLVQTAKENALRELPMGKGKGKATSKEKGKQKVMLDAVLGEKEIGERVYCRSKHGGWSWAEVTNKHMIRGRQYYSIKYDDEMHIGKYNPQWGMASRAHQRSTIVPCDPKKCIPETKPRPVANKAVAEFAESILGEKDHENGDHSEGSIVGYSSLERRVKEESMRSTLPGIPSSLSLEELYRARCGECQLCRKNDCQNCVSCLRSQESVGNRPRQVCVRKMCCLIDSDKKAQEAVGFPPRWRFKFVATDPKRRRVGSIQGDPGLDGLRLLPPNGRVYYSLTAAFNHNPAALKDIETISRTFLKHVGDTRQGCKHEHVLVGRGICEQWTDVQNQKMIVYGVISEYCEDKDDEAKSSFTVTYNVPSRNSANFAINGCGGQVPVSRMLRPELAWGGCLLNEEVHHTGPRCTLPLLQSHRTIDSRTWRWIPPDMRSEEVELFEGKLVPKVALVVRGCRIVLTVKQSTIPFAGYGVFAKAEYCDGDSGKGSFDLKCGELVDLGVYAPFCSTHKKKASVFCVKAYIHSYSPEGWSFDADSNDMIYDLTDEFSGSITEEARSRLLCYVNECTGDAKPTVQAEFDPTGAVHFLLGVVDEQETKLSIPTSSELEIFAYYGDGYENVRLRNGYSQLNVGEKTKRMKQLKKEDSEHCDDVEQNYSAADVAACVDYLESLYSDPDCSQLVPLLVRERSCTILHCLKKRCRLLLELTDQENRGKMVHYSSKIDELLADLEEESSSDAESLEDGENPSEAESFDEEENPSDIKTLEEESNPSDAEYLEDEERPSNVQSLEGEENRSDGGSLRVDGENRSDAETPSDAASADDYLEEFLEDEERPSNVNTLEDSEFASDIDCLGNEENPRDEERFADAFFEQPAYPLSQTALSPFATCAVLEASHPDACPTTEVSSNGTSDLLNERAAAVDDDESMLAQKNSMYRLGTTD